MSVAGAGGRDAAGWYTAYALASLLVVLAAGTLLRLAFLAPGALGGLAFRNVVHAHSHLAFFGWATPALFALLARATGGAVGRVWHAHAVAAASAAAFAGFLFRGYDPLTIALSALHVALWMIFTAQAWGALPRVEGEGRGFYRAALLFLVLAGLGTLGPALLPGEAGAVELFLTPFTAGWLWLGAMGACYGAARGTALSRAALLLGAAGVLPSLAMHAGPTPPAAWVPLVGAGGMGMLALSSLCFGVDLARSARAWSARQGVAGAALLKGAAEVVALTGVVPGAMGNHFLVIAYLHLVLLGGVTPALLARLAPAWPRVAVLGHGGGVGVMLLSLALIGLPNLPVAVAGATGILLALALAGGAASAVSLGTVAARALLPPSLRVRLRPSASPVLKGT